MIRARNTGGSGGGPAGADPVVHSMARARSVARGEAGGAVSVTDVAFGGLLLVALHEAGLEAVSDKDRGDGERGIDPAAREIFCGDGVEFFGIDSAERGEILDAILASGISVYVREGVVASAGCGGCPYCQGIGVEEYPSVGGRCWETGWRRPKTPEDA